MLVSEKSALGTNSVPSSGTMKTLVTKMASAQQRGQLVPSDQRRMAW
jgi:hypothetical protein